MAITVLLCTDGSERSEDALRAGLGVVAPADRVVIATVVEPLDPTLVVGTGMAGGVMSPGEVTVMQEGIEEHGQSVAERLRTDLGLADAELQVLAGSPGPAICELAAALPASVVVIGSRAGRVPPCSARLRVRSRRAPRAVPRRRDDHPRGLVSVAMGRGRSQTRIWARTTPDPGLYAPRWRNGSDRRPPLVIPIDRRA